MFVEIAIDHNHGEGRHQRTDRDRRHPPRPREDGALLGQGVKLSYHLSDVAARRADEVLEEAETPSGSGWPDTELAIAGSTSRPSACCATAMRSC